MLARRLTSILNVSDMEQSFAWFEKLGWEKGPRSFSVSMARAVAEEEVGVWMSVWVDGGNSARLCG